MVEQELGPAKVPTQTKLTVVLDKSAPWRSRWEQGERLTGVPELDDILLAYDIQIESGLFPDSGYYHVIVPREVNAYALENHLAKASRSLGLIQAGICTPGATASSSAMVVLCAPRAGSVDGRSATTSAGVTVSPAASTGAPSHSRSLTMALRSSAASGVIRSLTPYIPNDKFA